MLTQSQEGKDVENLVFQVAEDYGLDVEEELDEVGVKYLGTYVNARTSKHGPELRIDLDFHNFFNQSEEEQRRTILHELIHVKQFNNNLHEWAKQEFDISEDFAEKLDGTIWEDVKSVEGETELILSSFFPENDSSYPYAQSAKERELESLGLDIESEITNEIEQEADEILGEYREIQDVEVEDNIYKEKGSIAGLDYEVAVLSDEAENEGPKKVEEYLKGEITSSIDYGIEANYDFNSSVEYEAV